MAKANEVLRVGAPIPARRLRALLDAAELTESATIRHYRGQFIVDEPERTLDGFDDHDKADEPPLGGS